MLAQIVFARLLAWTVRLEAPQKQGHHRFFYALIYRVHAYCVIDVGDEDSALISKI